MPEGRREFIKKIGVSAIGLTVFGDFVNGASLRGDNFFKISLAQWSLYQSLFNGKLTNMAFPEKTKKDFGIDIVEYVSVFFNKREADQTYLRELKERCNDLDVTSHLIMVDGEGDLGDLNQEKRQKAVENHYKWVTAAKFLGCKSIRVNASGKGTKDEVAAAAVDGLSKLTEFGKTHGINVIVENHGGYSSNGKWLSEVIRKVNDPYCGTLPDFGNFRTSATEEYDKYLGVKELLPYAKGISAKTFAFDDQGYETTIDYRRMFDLIKNSGWKGIVGIEYEGAGLSADEGIRATKRLLENMKKMRG